MKLQLGTKVMPFRKSIGCEFREDDCWKKAQSRNQNFLYVIDYIDDYEFRNAERIENRKNNEKGYQLSDVPTDFIGNFYLESDLVLYMADATLEEFAAKFKQGADM